MSDVSTRTACTAGPREGDVSMGYEQARFLKTRPSALRRARVNSLQRETRRERSHNLKWGRALVD
eukprot:2171103-Rhodomonas_salina.2